MHNSPSKKPSLLTGSGNAAGSTRILATLDRRPVRDSRAHRIRFGKRRSDSSRFWWLAAALCVIACIGVTSYTSTSWRTDGSAQRHTTIAAAHPQATNIPAHEPLIVATHDQRVDVETEPAQDTAKIINMAPAEQTAPIHTSPSKTALNSRLQSSRSQSAAASTPATAINRSANSTAALPSDSSVSRPAVTYPAKTSRAPTAPAAATSNSTRSSNAASDSDVDLLAALIARARQRDPAPETKQDDVHCAGNRELHCKP